MMAGLRDDENKHMDAGESSYGSGGGRAKAVREPHSHIDRIGSSALRRDTAAHGVGEGG